MSGALTRIKSAIALEIPVADADVTEDDTDSSLGA